MLDPEQRHAVAVYVTTAESVMAGGANIPSASLTNANGAAQSRESRQFSALTQVELLNAMEKAVGTSGIDFAGRPSIPVLYIWRSLILGQLFVATILQSYGMKRSKARNKACKAAFLNSADRVATAIGRSFNPWVHNNTLL